LLIESQNIAQCAQRVQPTAAHTVINEVSFAQNEFVHGKLIFSVTAWTHSWT
jgi:hypothetical protein